MKVSGFLLQYDQSETFIIITRQDKKKNIHDEISSSSYIYLYTHNMTKSFLGRAERRIKQVPHLHTCKTRRTVGQNDVFHRIKIYQQKKSLETSFLPIKKSVLVHCALKLNVGLNLQQIETTFVSPQLFFPIFFSKNIYFFVDKRIKNYVTHFLYPPVDLLIYEKLQYLHTHTKNITK